MNIHTINAIGVLLTLFTEEEKQGLKITLGAREISLEDQFIGRWYKATPRFFDSVFLAKAAHIINGNKLLFLRVIEFNKPEFQEKLRVMLTDPDSYVKLKETKVDNKDLQKGVSIGQADTLARARGATKQRAGLTESGQEYLDIEKLWDQEDNRHLSQGLPAPTLAGTLEVDPTKPGIEGISATIKTRERQSISWGNPGEEDSSREDMPLQSITINQGRTHGINESVTNNLNFKDQKKELDGKTVTKDVVRFEALQLMTATKIKDPRETAFQKLDVLFNQCQ